MPSSPGLSPAVALAALLVLAGRAGAQTPATDSTVRRDSAVVPVVVPPPAEQPPVARIFIDDDGINIVDPDGPTRLAVSFRAQLLSTLEVPPDDVAEPTELDARVRRARIKFGGALWDPRLGVAMELGLSGNDQIEFTGTVLDARVTWRQTPNLRFAAGITKLPSNRQRVISSSAMQFAERGVVNNTFTLDRDYLVMATYARGGRVPWSLAGVVSTGEGREAAGPDVGLAYTTRVDVQPLGPFSPGNTLQEGDLAREPAPRLLLGLVLSHNDRTWRTRGQLGARLDAPRDLSTVIADAMFKYQGWALYGEAAWRGADRLADTAALPEIGDDPRGSGVLLQASYLTRGGWEPALRLGRVELRDGTDASQASLNVSRYLDGHSVKYQLEVGREWGVAPGLRPRWLVRANLEVGL